MAGTLATVAIANPAAISVLGVIAAFAGGVAVYRGIKGKQQEAKTEEILGRLEQQMKQGLSLAKALAGLEEDALASHGDCLERLRTLQNVFTDDPSGVGERLALHPDFAAFVTESMQELEANDDQFRIALDNLIALAIENKAINREQIDKLDRVLANQDDQTKALQRIEEGQLTTSDLERFEKSMLAKLEAMKPDQSVNDESTDRDLIAAIDRLAQDAQRGVMTAQRVLQSDNPGDVADYLAARRRQLELGKEALNEKIDEEAIKLDRELAAVAYTTGRIDEARDALKRLLESDPDDSDAINRLGHIHRIVGELEQAKGNYERVLELAPDDTGRAVAIGNLGIILKTRGDLDGAEAMHRKALAIDEKLGQLNGMASNYGNLGLVLQTRGDLDGAEAMYRKALDIFKKLGQLEGIASAYGNLGIILRNRGDLDGAEAMHRKALAIDEKVGRLEGMANQNGNLGLILETRGDLDGAEATYRKALDIFEKLGQLEGMAKTYGNLGIILKTRGDLDGAEAMYRKALAINEQLGRLTGMASNYGNLGNILSNRGNFDGAEAMHHKALDIFEKLGQLEGMACASRKTKSITTTACGNGSIIS